MEFQSERNGLSRIYNHNCVKISRFFIDSFFESLPAVLILEQGGVILFDEDRTPE